MQNKRIIVQEGNIRLDAYLADTGIDLSRTKIKELIKDGKVKVNDKEIKKASYMLEKDMKIEIEYEDEKESKLEADDTIKLNIVYEDDDIIIVNKQKGLVVHPGNGNKNKTLVNALLAYAKANKIKLSMYGGETRPGIVHRLDKDTSGLLIVAKNDKVHKKLANMFKNHEIEKTYYALVRGVIKEDESSIIMPITRDLRDRTKMTVDKHGKPARTNVKVIERFDKYTLVEVKIETGRTHQIRVHLSQIGFPIIGDAIYSNGKNEFNVEGQMLHSKSLKFIHPITNKELYVDSELPEYFEKIIKELEERNEE